MDGKQEDEDGSRAPCSVNEQKGTGKCMKAVYESHSAAFVMGQREKRK